MGMIIGFVNRFLDRFEANPFFSTILASFLMAVPAYVAAGLGLGWVTRTRPSSAR